MAESNINRELFGFIAACPTAWHTAESTASRLREAGYSELFEQEDWQCAPGGKYFVRRGGSSLIAFDAPERDSRGFMMMAAHGDSPCFKLKETPETPAAGVYRRLGVEKYGGMLCSSWLDRPLSVAGRVMAREAGRIAQRLVNIDRDLLLIPNVAIHMDRGANENKSYNANADMLPLFGAAEGGDGFSALIARELQLAAEDILAAELFVYSRSPGTVWGERGEFISAPRLDDLQCVFGCLKGLLASRACGSSRVLCVFDNEEVGSGTKQGADSDFLSDTLRRAWAAAGRPESELPRALAESFMVSADNAHSVHPNHPEFADSNDRPRMNGGVVIKYNANQKYTTDAASAAVFGEICRRAGAPVQRFSNRADLPGGSTLGNISSAHVAVDTVDIGLAQLAMHSACETAGAEDTAYLVSAAREFYSSALRKTRGGVEILAEKQAAG